MWKQENERIEEILNVHRLLTSSSASEIESCMYIFSCYEIVLWILQRCESFCWINPDKLSSNAKSKPITHSHPDSISRTDFANETLHLITDSRILFSCEEVKAIALISDEQNISRSLNIAPNDSVNVGSNHTVKMSLQHPLGRWDFASRWGLHTGMHANGIYLESVFDCSLIKQDSDRNESCEWCKQMRRIWLVILGFHLWSLAES